MRKIKRHGASAALFLVPLGMWAASGARVEKTLETTSSPRISVSNLVGTVVVKGWDRNQVHAVWVTSSPRVEIDAEQMPAAGKVEKIHFSTHCLDKQATAKEEEADYTLEIPLGSSLEIHNPEGSVTVERLEGDGWVDSVGGSVSVTDATGHLAVRSVGGSVEIVRPSGRVEANSVTGDIRFTNPASSKVRADTTSGNIVYEGDFVPAGDYILSSYRGNLDILCPASASFELRARTVHGKVDNELALTPKRHLPFSYGSGLFGTHNQGNATVQLTSYSGTIRIRPVN